MIMSWASANADRSHRDRSCSLSCTRRPTLRPFGITFEAANPSVLPHWTAAGCCVDLADPTRKIPIVLALALLTISRGAQRGANDHTHEATPGHTQPLRLQLNGSSSYT